MQEYSSAKARIDIERFLSNCLFSVKVVSDEQLLFINVEALDILSAENKALTWAASQKLTNVHVKAYPTLNAIESTIK